MAIAAPRRVRSHVLSLLSLGLFLATAACANGDFGRVKPSLVRADVHDWVGPAATGSVPSLFQPTDDERQLRDLAYPLIEPSYDRQRWYSVLAEHGYRDEIGRSFDRTAYAAKLMSSSYSSPSTRYAQLIDDLRNDITRLPAFFETAARVLDMDAKRRQSFQYIREIDKFERVNAERRMAENAAIVAMVRASLDRRAAAYRFALERLVIVTPSPQAVDAERELGRFKAATAIYRKWAPIARGEQVASYQ